MGSVCCPDHSSLPQTTMEENDSIEIANIDPEQDDRFASTLINMKSFTIERVLGKGAFGKVLLVSKTDTHELYAMKVISKTKLKSYKQKVHAIAERKILERVHSPFVVALHYAFQTATKLYLVMDFMKGGELFFHLRQMSRFTEDRTRFYIAEVLLAFEALHGKKVIYRDLKPENVLLDEDGHIKLADFNLSKLTEGSIMRTFTFCGTPEYISPEVLRGEPQSKAVDFWSLVGSLPRARCSTKC